MGLKPEEITAVETCLQAGDVIKSGAPEVDALGKALGRPVTAAERDAIWAEYQDRETGTETPTQGGQVWLGPALTRVILNHGQEVESSESPLPELDHLLAQDDRFEALLVPADEAAEAGLQLRTPGSKLNRIYRQAVKAVRG